MNFIFMGMDFTLKTTNENLCRYLVPEIKQQKIIVELPHCGNPYKDFLPRFARLRNDGD